EVVRRGELNGCGAAARRRALTPSGDALYTRAQPCGRASRPLTHEPRGATTTRPGRGGAGTWDRPAAEGITAMIIDTHVHILNFPSLDDLGDKIRTMEDGIAFRTKFPDLYYAVQRETPSDNT